MTTLLTNGSTAVSLGFAFVVEVDWPATCGLRLGQGFVVALEVDRPKACDLPVPAKPWKACD